MKNNIFCLKRLYYLMRRQIMSHTLAYAMGFGSLLGSALVLTLLSGIGDTNFHISSSFPLYIVAFLIGGYVFTSSIFSELNSPARSAAALTLPASNLERLVNAWLLSAVVYPIIAIFGMMLISLVTGLVHGQQTVSNIVAVIYSRGTLNLIIIYIITQSIFLFGAIYFRKHNFFKTIGSVLLVQLTIQVVLILVGLALFGRPWSNFGDEFTAISPGFEKFITTTVFELIKFVFYYVLAPFFWLLTWFGIKEREV